ncbi:DUF4397 domain-containing protein [Dactylosporangium sp. NPDC051541]|uniref:DUF4397 domain-containing protein n=1 Tax=Dactylosporangium sp. NPDC051541 TaxID=3363977 RepID=UPI00378957D5
MFAAPQRRRLAALAAAALLGLSVTAVAAPGPAAAAAGVGYVRLAHLSPDTPPVDVYLSSVSGAIAQQKFDAVGYGTVSKYLPLPPGTYAVAMRKQGDPASAAPVLSTQATVEEGKAYTVAGTGKFADLGLRVINDDLGRPEGGKAKVRVIQASVKQPVLNVAMASGTKIADDVKFATTTDYLPCDPGKWTLRLTPPSGSAAVTTVSAPLKAGAVYSLIILDGKGGLTAELRTDAAAGEVPTGGVDTGGGGTAGEGGLNPLIPIGGGAAVLLLAVAGGLFWRRSRARATAA